MAFILNINAAFETAFVALCFNDEVVAQAQSSSQKNHSSFLEPAIKNICNSAQISLNYINAVSVINGPGSYTGLRVALSSAKAIAYALKKPLVLLNTLDVMALALKRQSPLAQQENLFYCPLIDARRMEVYTALYDDALNLVKNYSSEIINQHFLEEKRKTNLIIAGGNGSFKLQELNIQNIEYINPLMLQKPAAILSYKAFISENFSHAAYAEPFYLKAVYLKK